MSRLFTKVLNSGSVKIDYPDGVTSFTIQANSSSACTITGNITFKGMTSGAVILENGESYTQQSATNTPIDGVTITWVSGTIDLLISF
jgi:hypothetical protein